MRPVDLGVRFFNTKKAATEHFQRMLWAGQAGVAIEEPAATELFHLLKRHPQFEAKRGIGIHHQLAHIRLVSRAANIARAREGMPNKKDRQLSFADLLTGRPGRV